VCMGVDWWIWMNKSMPGVGTGGRRRSSLSKTSGNEQKITKTPRKPQTKTDGPNSMKSTSGSCASTRSLRFSTPSNCEKH